MPREVVRLFTAGTVIEPGMLDAGRNNYLAAVVFEDDRAGLAYADITTGEFSTTQLPSRHALNEELARLAPSELLVADSENALFAEAATVSKLPDWRFELGTARQTLLNHFAVSSLDSFGCEGKALAARAAGGVLFYLQETQKGSVAQIQRLSTYSVDGFMALGMNTRRHLELTESISGERYGSLLNVLQKTVTPMGARLLRQRLTRPLLRADIRVMLKGMPDLERLTNRVLSGSATPRDLGHIGQALAAIPDLRALLSTAPPFQSLVEKLDPCPETASLIASAIVENPPPNLNKMGVILPGFSAELDGVMNSSAHARNWVADLEPRERERTGINTLKVGYNRVFGYYLEVTRANTDLVPEDYIRKQTLTNAERYITPDLKEYETLILNAEERIVQIERRLFVEVTLRVAQAADRLLSTAAALAKIDVAANLAEVAAANDYVRPLLANDNTLDVRDGRHPVVEHTISDQAALGERFIPNDARFTDEERIQIITGPNMSGKSTYLRQVALITLLAQIGSFVPATSAHIGLVDRIFTRIGAHDELHAGRSTFMVEMVETAEILNHATHRSLLILDEIGRGTSTYDGLSLAWAIIEYLHNHPRLKPRTLFATHYHELTGLADLLPQVTNYNVDVAEEGDHVTFLHKIVPGGADRSYGIYVAKLAGLPRDVVIRANEVLGDLEKHAPTASVEPGRLSSGQQMALFPEASPILQELQQLDVTAMTPLEAINKLYEWQRRYASDDN
jgi:DNA mismatch repair protein MutS